jgi:hypothetical protein
VPVEAASRFLVKRPASSGSSWAPDALASGLEPLAGGQVELEFSPPGGSPPLNYRDPIGGAPGATVVPVRIAGVFGSVIHIYSSSLARGLHHALGVPEQRSPCDGIPAREAVALREEFVRERDMSRTLRTLLRARLAALGP